MAEYISREAFKARIREQQKKCASPDEIAAFTVFSFLLQAVDEEPAADVQPVSQGRWIDIYEWAKMHDSIPSGTCLYYWCSECQKEQEKKSNFCPHCGARMDGDK